MSLIHLEDMLDLYQRGLRESEEPDDIDETHGRVGGLAYSEGDVNVEVGQGPALLRMRIATCAHVITNRKLALGTRGPRLPPGQAITALGRGLEVGSPDSWLL